MSCEWCGEDHKYKCPLVEAIEYFPGEERKIRRVKFFRPKRLKPSKNGNGPSSFGPAMSMPAARGYLAPETS